jgi:mRNA-degrading endonuclease toxin of MazEF toxin-antitoxin module
VILTSDDGVQTACAVNVDNIQTVSQSNLSTFITHLSPNKIREVCLAIAFALGFDAKV